MKVPRAPRARGFTLLEMLIAIAILGLGLTIILSSQVGLFSSATRGESLTVASNLLRCKMSELELDLQEKGYPLTDETDDGDCCDDEESSNGFTCSWKIERVELPSLPADSAEVDAGGLAGDAKLGSGTTQGTGIGDFGKLAQGVDAGLPGAPGELGGPASMLEQLTGGEGSSGIEGMVMGLVYPGLKPLLEASIRRVTVKVHWREGSQERDFEATQFVTNPQQGDLATADQLGLDGGVGSLLGVNPGGGLTTGSGTAPTPTSNQRTSPNPRKGLR